MGHQLSEQERGKIMGAWGSSASIGNLLGAFLFTLLQTWLSFQWNEVVLVVSLSILLFSILFFAVVKSSVSSEELIEKQRPNIKEVLKTPGVISYTLVYSCCKFMNYMWMFWLPYYLRKILGFSTIQIGSAAFLLETGAITGAFLGGWISDKLNSRNLVIRLMLLFGIPATLLLLHAGPEEKTLVYVCAFSLGFSITGTCYLINACVSVDLAVSKQQVSLISGIMDGTGSLAAGAGVFLVGYLVNFSWTYAFIIAVAANCVSILLLQVISCKKTS